MIDYYGQISALLAESRAAHEEYRANVPRRVSDGPTKTVAIPGDEAAAGAALLRACRQRTEAHALDPNLEAPAWRDEAVSHDHDALLDFYAQQLSR